ncbi:cobalt transport protein CbiN [Methanoculleus chikugoensis]|jgi:cobalt/nickel transport protein|uniref:Cobalt transport protein CbiN n=1 Tax=Methanoculleus chikugoensis TaxID=118126 RepID=A0A1M4MMJ7_9EURY|nr:PDGLE domain-containing protein [Methanoculleus chikugoensis]MDD4568099.1 PDGLE domain-containing protein [Methanoculleus chikugoensis]SCL76077.1 cobalt transport protein CbiN [Methanoculleus chikugoensis]
METKQFVVIGIAIALAIAVAAPFLASGNPDGLESAFFSIYEAKPFMGSELDEDAAGAAEEQAVAATGNDFSYEALMPDYSIPGMDKAGEVLAVVIGTLLMLALVFAVARVSARPDN